MELNDIFSVIDKFDSSTAQYLELSFGDLRIKLDRAGAGPAAAQERNGAVAQAPAKAREAANEHEYIRAPLVGTFYAASSPGEAAFAPAGSRVREGQTVCILEAMKMLSEVPAPFDCVIEEALVGDGELAGYDQPLFRVRKL